MIGLIILDIDGVLTDGRKYYGLGGETIAKTYCDKDFTAIKRFRGSGIPVCFVSGDEKVNLAMATNRRIPFYSSRGKDKADFVDSLSVYFGVDPEHMVYVGDDLFDLSIMKVVGHPYCPSDACRDLIRLCETHGNILKSKGGENVVAELFDVLIDSGMITDCTMQDIENLDKEEIF